MEPIHKFNNGNGATLCRVCRVIINHGFNDLLLCPKCQKEALEVLQTIANDAEMALDGSWNKSDEGFEAQLLLLRPFIDNE